MPTNLQTLAVDQGGSGGDFTFTVSATTAGSTITVGILAGGGFTTTPTVTDDKSNSYVLEAGDITADISPSAMFVCVGAIGGATSITVHNAGKLIVFFAEDTGIAGVDVANINPNQAATNAPTVSATTTVAGDLAYVLCTFGNGLATLSAGTGWTPVSGSGITAGQHDNTVASISAFMQRQTLGASGAVTGTVNAGSTSTGFDSAIVALLASGGSGPQAAIQTSGPGISPNTRTMFQPRPTSNFIVQGNAQARASGHGFAYGLLIGAPIVPPIGYARTAGPGVSPDYRRTFDQIQRSTSLPVLVQINGVAFGSGAAFASLGGTGNLQGLALGQGSGTANLLGAGALTGAASGESYGYGTISNGVLTNITGVAFGSGHTLGTLTATGALTGTAQVAGGAVGSLTGEGALSGVSSAEGGARGQLGGIANLAGIAFTAGQANALLTGAGALSGFAGGEGQAIGSLAGTAALTALALGQGFGAASTLLGSLQLTGNALAAGFSFGSMQAVASLQGVTLGQSYAVGLLLQQGAGQMQGVAAGFSFAYGLLSGTGHKYGWATVKASSPNGFPVARACYIEGSASTVVASYFDASGLPFAPNLVRYRIDDVTSGANIVPWTQLDPAVANEVTVTSAQNAMISLSRQSEAHQALFEITDGFGNVDYADVQFDLIRVVGLN